MRIAASVAADKERHPEKFCPVRRCLWRTGDGSRCPRHPAPQATAATADYGEDYASHYDENRSGYYDHTAADER